MPFRQNIHQRGGTISPLFRGNRAIYTDLTINVNKTMRFLSLIRDQIRIGRNEQDVSPLRHHTNHAHQKRGEAVFDTI